MTRSCSVALALVFAAVLAAPAQLRASAAAMATGTDPAEAAAVGGSGGAAGGPRKSLPRPLVCVDPGHGGEKEGARVGRGDGALKEKQIALAISRALAAELEHRGATAILTREDDRRVMLADRIAFSNRAGADLFVSVHCNAMPGPSQKTRGIETYFLSAEASGEQAERVAAAENAEAGAAEAAPADPLATILSDLARTQAHQDASALAYEVQRQLAADLGAPDRGVHQAPFLVLMGAQMPAILAEVGYLSNPDEAKKLATPEYQRRIARSLADALLVFWSSIQRRNETASSGAGR